MDSSKKPTPESTVVDPPTEILAPPSQGGGQQLLEETFPRTSTRRIFHSSPFDYVQYSVKDESPPRPSEPPSSSGTKSGEKRKRGIGRGRVRGFSPNRSSYTESSRSGGRHPSSGSSSSSSPSPAGAAAAMATPERSRVSGIKKNYGATRGLHHDLLEYEDEYEEEENFEGDSTVNVNVRGLNISTESRRALGSFVGSGRARPRSFGMGITTRGGARSLGSLTGSAEENEWAGGYGSDGIRARQYPLPRGTVRGLNHFPGVDDPYYPALLPENKDEQGNKEEKKEEEVVEEAVEEAVVNEDVDSILQNYFEKYQL